MGRFYFLLIVLIFVAPCYARAQAPTGHGQCRQGCIYNASCKAIEIDLVCPICYKKKEEERKRKAAEEEQQRQRAMAEEKRKRAQDAETQKKRIAELNEKHKSRQVTISVAPLNIESKKIEEKVAIGKNPQRAWNIKWDKTSKMSGWGYCENGSWVWTIQPKFEDGDAHYNKWSCGSEFVHGGAFCQNCEYATIKWCIDCRPIGQENNYQKRCGGDISYLRKKAYIINRQGEVVKTSDDGNAYVLFNAAVPFALEWQHFRDTRGRLSGCSAKLFNIETGEIIATFGSNYTNEYGYEVMGSWRTFYYFSDLKQNTDSDDEFTRNLRKAFENGKYSVLYIHPNDNYFQWKGLSGFLLAEDGSYKIIKDEWMNKSAPAKGDY